MGDWPNPVGTDRTFHRMTISSLGMQTMIGDSAFCGRQTGSGVAWFAANTAVTIPFTIEREVVVSRMGWYNGATVSGTVDAGVYDYDAKTLLVSTGPITQTGASVPQDQDVTNTLLEPGDYRMALLVSNTTGTIFREAHAIQTGLACGVKNASVGGATLNAPLTLGDPSTAYWPFFWLDVRDAAI